MKYDVASQSDVGQVRSKNEDSFLVDEALNLFIVADGMGGYEKGEVASQIACQSIYQFIKEALTTSPVLSKSQLLDAAQKANANIRKNISESPNKGKMGSTVVTLWLNGDKALILNIGDSRGYRFRNGKLEQISVDHSLVQETKAAGIKKELAPQFKNIVTRALGMKESVEGDVFSEKLHNGDLFLLCTDGLHGMVPEEKIVEILSKGQDITSQLSEVIAQANKEGGKDNITGILIKIRECDSSHKRKEVTETFQIPAYQLKAFNEKKEPSVLFKILTFILIIMAVALSVLILFREKLL
ncbi:MAG: serine/threonine-protein phosphatase [Candidatus Aureabacteria bacterium]|nr:serine/threonine-protein phosphatase [Candidatus Auribacterota bacterium]